MLYDKDNDEEIEKHELALAIEAVALLLQKSQNHKSVAEWMAYVVFEKVDPNAKKVKFEDVHNQLIPTEMLVHFFLSAPNSNPLTTSNQV